MNNLRSIIYNPHFIARYCLYKKIKKHSPLLKGMLLDIGCGRKPYKKIFKKVERYVGIDVPDTFSDNKEIDIYADALELPLKNNSFDCILSTETLEHIPQPDLFFKEVNRVLKSQGILLLTAPQTWPLHEEPFDYFRYTEYGLKQLAGAAGFEIIKIEKTTGTVLTLGQLLSDYISTLARITILKYPVLLLCGLVQILTIILGFLTLNSGKLTLDYVLLARKRTINQRDLETKQLDKILCCPKCRSDLKFGSDVECKSCGTRYQIINNRPVFTKGRK